MCGIVGITPVNNLDLVRQMNNQIIHRGPDDEGYYFDESSGVSLGMRRLSIIDLHSGNQPMSNEDDTIYVVCNGEIYNSPELRKSLLKKGHQFKTDHSDIEVILHLYEEYGFDLLSHLNGMFAFVLFDKKKQLLFGARDRLGIKPLYYSFKDNKLAYSSEIKSMLQLPWISKEVDLQSTSDYLSYQFIPSPNSPIKDIKKIPAGNYFVFDLANKDFAIHEYWSIDINPISMSRNDWIERVRSEMLAAVKRWTLSDVPIGVSLSGGIDSSALVGFLAKAGYSDIKTFSIGFSDDSLAKYDELDLAKKVSEHWGTEHLEVKLVAKTVLSDLDSMVYSLDEPYGGGLPSWFVYKTMADHVKVGLTGTGGDELFGNYGKAKLYTDRKQQKLRAIAKALIKNRSLEEANYYTKFPHAAYSWMYLRDFHKKDLVLKNNSEFKDCRPSEDLIEELWKNKNTSDPRDITTYFDFPNQLAEEFLHVTDRFSMAHSIEARVPFLDHTLVETVMQIPAEMRISDGIPKQFLKDVVEDLIPPDVFSAKKRGFILPLKEWTRGELRDLVETYLSPQYINQQQIFNPKLYEKMVQPHLKGIKDNTNFIWTLLMYQLWYDKLSAS